MAFTDKKISIFTGQNDAPALPSATKAGNASDLIKKYNDLIDELIAKIQTQDEALITISNTSNSLSATITTLINRITQLESASSGSAAVMKLYERGSYTNGDRAALFTVSGSSSILSSVGGAAGLASLLDGKYHKSSAANGILPVSTVSSGEHFFTFKPVTDQKFVGVRIKFATTSGMGVWVWHGYNADFTWTQISNEITLTRITPQAHTIGASDQSIGVFIPFFDTKVYKNYKMTLIGGTVTSTTRIDEIEFYV
jgi:hypothetical protein